MPAEDKSFIPVLTGPHVE